MNKKVLSLIGAALLTVSAAYPASLLGYQASVVDADGKPVVSTPVTFSVSIRQNVPTGDVVYAENISTETSPAGIAYFNIGENGGLENLDWSSTSYFLDMSYDYGQGYKSLGSTMIVSVPRAMHADSAASLVLSSPSGKKFKVTIDDNGQVVASPM